MLMACVILLLFGCGPAGQSAAGDGGAKETLYVQASVLKARVEPSDSAMVIGRLPEGSALQLVERKGDWAKVEQGDRSFWVASRYIGASRPARIMSGEGHGLSGRKGASAGGQSYGTPPSGKGNRDRGGDVVNVDRPDTNMRDATEVSSAFAVGTAGAGNMSTNRQSFAALSPAKKSKKSTSRKKAKKKKRQSFRSESYSGSCPCRGGTVCIGPRGGRYCITSGGNKRYGV